MKISELINNINSKEDFIFFIQNLSNDYHKNQEEWENQTIPAYLESIASWAEDMEGYYENMGVNLPADIDWKFMALLFYMGKIYE